MIELRFEANVRASAERVFSLLVDLRNYDAWLPRSSAFHGTTHISEGPIDVGTIDVEPGPLGTRHGIVTRLVRPTNLDVEQPMTLRPRALGMIGIKLFHTLNPANGSVHILRRLELAPKGPASLMMPLVTSAFRIESQRMMKTLKEFAEKDGENRSP
jgi:uncharacterized protein YndB with AHSA1/START domain